MTTSKDIPAFPTDTATVQYGMTLRDYFAAKAMHAYVTDTQIAWTDSTFEKAADAAYRLADYMLEARK